MLPGVNYWNSYHRNLTLRNAAFQFPIGVTWMFAIWRVSGHCGLFILSTASPSLPVFHAEFGYA